MAQRFPRYRPRAGHPMDSVELNESMRPFAEEIDGRLGEHNWTQNFIGTRTSLHQGAVIHVNTASQAVDMDLETGTGRPRQGTTGFSEYDISDNCEWVVVDSVTVTKETANSLLWIIAAWQIQQYGSTSNFIGTATFVPGAQFALRVDGAILDTTITGGLDRSNDRKGEALSYIANGMRTDAILPVVPGQHTIELVARQTRGEDNAIWTPIVGSQPSNRVGNRELIVVTGDPFQSDVAASGPSWSPIAEGASVTAASYNTPHSAIATEINDLDTTSIQRQSLHNGHIGATVVHAAAFTTIGQGGSASLTSAAFPYPGFGVNAGWVVVQDAGANLLSLTFTATDMSEAALRGVLILANVHVVEIQSSAAPSGRDGENAYAVFAIQVRTGGTWRTIGRSERYTNAELSSSGSDEVPCRKDVALAAFATTADFGGNNSLDGVRVVASVEDRTGFAGNTVTVTTEHGDLLYAILQAGSA